MPQAGCKRKRDDAAIDSDANHSEEDEIDFEDIELESAPNNPYSLAANTNTNQHEVPQAISITLTKQDGPKQKYPKAVIAQKIRFEIHKTHLMCLLTHAAIRHQWCADPQIMHALEILRPRIKGTIHAKESAAQLQRTRILRQSLENISHVWSTSFKISSRGLSKSKWYTDTEMIEREETESVSQVSAGISKATVLEAARKLEGDRDLGAQLLVSFLRVLGFEARLVCSLQPLSLTVSKIDLREGLHKGETVKDHVQKSLQHVPASRHEAGRKFSRPRLGRPATIATVARPEVPFDLYTRTEEAPYPVYWAEVFDPAAQKWYSLDPLVTGTVDKPNLLEPPQSEEKIALAYVIAYSLDGSIKDVTHRYTRQFNAKVRRHRVESISAKAAAWWLRIMKFYRPRHVSDQNAIEDAELAQKSLAEGIPSNVADLKNHPLFVVERHLHKNEIITPRRECGSIRIGKGQPVITEKVYPRKYVKVLRSKQFWYMRGRQVKEDQEPMKILASKQTEHSADQETMTSHTEAQELYAEDQTTLYIPSSVIDGVVPKNSFGNVDLFVPSMLPTGALHLPQRDAEAAAKLLAIDYATAVTGFDHANRQSLPVRSGVVVASEFGPAMLLILEAMAEERSLEISRKTSLAALDRWSRFLRTLRIRQHVETRYATEAVNAKGAATDEGHCDTGGGFM